MPLLRQAHRIHHTTRVQQTIPRQHPELRGSHPNLLQAPGHAQRAKHPVQRVAQLRRLPTQSPSLQDVRHDRVAPDEPLQLLLAVGVHTGVVLQHRGQQDATGLAVAHAQGPQLVADAVARAREQKARRVQQDDQDVVRGQLAVQPGLEVGGCGFRGQQAPDEEREGLLGREGALFGHGGGGVGLDAVVDGADAGGEPDPLWRGEAEGWVEDDEPGEHLGVGHDGFEVRFGRGAAAVFGVFACGEGGGDEDHGHGRRVAGGGAVAEVFGGVLLVGFSLLDHSLEVVCGLGAIGEGVDDDFGAVGQAASAQGDEEVSVFGPHVVDDGHEVVPWRVGADAGPCSDVDVAERLLELLDVVGVLRQAGRCDYVGSLCFEGFSCMF